MLTHWFSVSPVGKTKTQRNFHKPNILSIAAGSNPVRCAKTYFDYDAESVVHSQPRSERFKRHAQMAVGLPWLLLHRHLLCSVVESANSNSNFATIQSVVGVALVGCSREPTLIEFMLHSGLQKTLISKRASVSVRIALWYRLAPTGPGRGRTKSLHSHALHFTSSVEWFFRAPLVWECVGGSDECFQRARLQPEQSAAAAAQRGGE